MGPKEVLKYAEKNGAKLVDLKFIDRPRRRVLLRARGGVLRLRRHPLRFADQPQLLLRGFVGGALELGPRGVSQPRLQAQLQGWLLPGRAHRLAGEPARRDGDDAA